MACPFVSGIAALVLAHEPGLSLVDLRERVMWTGDPLLDLRETTVTGLRVNAYNAVMGVYSVHIDTESPLPSGKVGQAYSKVMQVTGFAEPYTWSWSMPQYVERETANGFTFEGTAQNWNSEGATWRLDLSFSFPFYGSNYTHLWVCSNGYLEFSANQPTSEDISDINLLAQRKIIAPYWSDLTTDALVGSLDIFVWQPDANSIGIRWKAQEGDWLLGFPKNFSVILHSDGTIAMHYGEENFSLVGGVVGISSGNGIDYRVSEVKTNKFDLTWAPTSLWVAGALPPGLNIVPATGEITGTPTIAGTYDFDVSVEDDTGGTDTRAFSMKIFPATGLVADFTASPLRGEVPFTVQFQDQSTSDTAITEWLWNMGDAHTRTAQNPSYTYNSPGNYTVALTVTDIGGSDTMTRFRYIEVLPGGPDVDFTASPTAGEVPLFVTFTDLTTASSPSAYLFIWEWYFGDDGYDWSWDTGNTTHTYTEPGIYDVTLVVSDALGGIGLRTKYNYIVVVGAGPVLGVSVTPATLDLGFLEPAAVVTNAGGALVVKNTGEVNEDLSLRIKDQDDRNEWTAGVPGPNTYTLSTRLADVIGTFGANDVLTTALQWCNGALFGGGGLNMAPNATVNQWFQFKSPTTTTGAHAGSQHAITVELGCRQAE